MISHHFKTLLTLSAAINVIAQDSSDTPTPSSASASSSASAAVSALPTWSWTQDRMHGMNLGNWLLLEKWMSNTWFNEACGNESATDQWSFLQSIDDEDKAKEVLQNHYDTWITDEDIANISRAGFNQIRVPMGYWSWIKPAEGEPYVDAGEVDQLERIIETASEHGLYTVIDLHGLPGSQNGQDNSGHIGGNNFFNSDNQKRADELVDAVIDFVQSSPYRSSISALAACNEPVYYTEDQYQTLVDYYERTYAKTSNISLPLMFHPGNPDVSALELWETFIAGKSPELAIFEYHPYPGRGASLDGSSADADSIINQVCYWADQFRGYGVPVSVTEWSLVSPITDESFYSRFWVAQTTAFAESGGSMFWTYKLNSTKLDDVADNRVYSYVDLANEGLIPLAEDGQNATEYLNSLDNPCSDNASPETWSSTVPSASTTITQALQSS